MTAGPLELRCACGWEVPDPSPLTGWWNAEEKGCLRREADGSYTMTCPECKGDVLWGIRYQSELPRRFRRGHLL